MHDEELGNAFNRVSQGLLHMLKIFLVFKNEQKRAELTMKITKKNNINP